jgi:hypothetical protein
MPRRTKLTFDEFYVLRVDSAGRPRGARFAKLKDKAASAAIDMRCRTLILQPPSVCRLAMRLPAGRMLGNKLVMPRIPPDLYERILTAAAIADRRRIARMAAGAEQASIWIKQLIQEAQTALDEAREINKRK